MRHDSITIRGGDALEGQTGSQQRPFRTGQNNGGAN